MTVMAKCQHSHAIASLEASYLAALSPFPSCSLVSLRSPFAAVVALMMIGFGVTMPGCDILTIVAYICC